MEYLQSVIEIPVRVTLSQSLVVDETDENATYTASLKELAADILGRLERKVGSGLFIGAYADAQTRNRI